MATRKQTIAFFGATGGSASTCLALALKDGYYCTALVRSAEKLLSILEFEHGVPKTTVDEYLTIHCGDAKTPSDVSKALVSPIDKTRLVDTIYFSIGAYPNFAFSLMQPFPLSDPTICESGMAAIFAAIEQLAGQGISATRTGEKPHLIAISATAPKNLKGSLAWPWITAPLYAWLLSGPQADKLNMEELVLADAWMHLRSFVMIRPAFLTNGVERGGESIRVGWEWFVEGPEGREQAPGPAKGWSISRKDLGGWVFRKTVVRGGWEGRFVSLCY